jgi:hypothetical protein
MLAFDFFGMTLVFATIAGLVYLLSWRESINKTTDLNEILERKDLLMRFEGLPLSMRIICTLTWMCSVGALLIGMLQERRLGFTMGIISVTFAVLFLVSFVNRRHGQYRQKNNKSFGKSLKRMLRSGGNSDSVPNVA